MFVTILNVSLMAKQTLCSVVNLRPFLNVIAANGAFARAKRFCVYCSQTYGAGSAARAAGQSLQADDDDPQEGLEVYCLAGKLFDGSASICMLSKT